MAPTNPPCPLGYYSTFHSFIATKQTMKQFRIKNIFQSFKCILIFIFISNEQTRANGGPEKIRKKTLEEPDTKENLFSSV